MCAEEVVELYNGTHIPAHVLDQTPGTGDTHMTQFLDLFSIPEATLFADISEVGRRPLPGSVSPLPPLTLPLSLSFSSLCSSLSLSPSLLSPLSVPLSIPSHPPSSLPLSPLPFSSLCSSLFPLTLPSLSSISRQTVLILTRSTCLQMFR